MSLGKLNCEHTSFESFVQVARLHENDDPNSPVTGYVANVRVRCAECKADFYWVAPTGTSRNEPMRSADGIRLQAPLTPVKDIVHSTEKTQITQHVEVEIVRAPRP